MNFYAENSNVGLTYGTISFTGSDWESDFIKLELDKHPIAYRPTVVATAMGTLANVNAHAIVQKNGSGWWEIKVYLSDGVAEAEGLIKINYTVLSTWAN